MRRNFYQCIYFLICWLLYAMALVYSSVMPVASPIPSRPLSQPLSPPHQTACATHTMSAWWPHIAPRRIHKIAKSDCQVSQVCPYVRPPGTTGFYDSYWRIFEIGEKIQISLKSGNNNQYCRWSRPIYISYHVSLISSQTEKSVRQNLCRKSKHTFYGQ